MAASTSAGEPEQIGERVTSSLAAGVSASVVGLLVFLVVHQLWIKPIWFIMPAGLPVAVIGGLAVGWAYFHIRSGLPSRPWNSAAMVGIILALLLPGMLLSFTHGPLFDLATAKVPPGQGWRVFTHFALELVVPALLVGAAGGWWLGRSISAALATALAGLALALGPGHNIPMFGTSPLAWKGHAIVLIIALASAITLVESEALVRGRT